MFSIPTVVIVIVAVVLLFSILKFATKIIMKIFGAFFIVAAAVFVLFYWNGGLLNLGNENFMLDEMQAKYCNSGQTVKCECIITPVLTKIKAEYSGEEFTKLQSNKTKSLMVILETLTKNRTEIRDCLREKNALNEWDEFVNDLKNNDSGNEFTDAFQKMKEDIKAE